MVGCRLELLVQMILHEGHKLPFCLLCHASFHVVALQLPCGVGVQPEGVLLSPRQEVGIGQRVSANVLKDEPHVSHLYALHCLVVTVSQGVQLTLLPVCHGLLLFAAHTAKSRHIEIVGMQGKGRDDIVWIAVAPAV